MLRPITEKTSFRRMWVKIKVKVQPWSMTVLQLKCQLMKSCNFWKDMFVESIKLTIEIFSTETCPKVPCNNSIWVEHGNDIKNEGRSKIIGWRMFWEEKADESFKNIGRMRLAGMNSSSNESYFFLSFFKNACIFIWIFLSLRSASNGEERNIKSSQSFTHFTRFDVSSRLISCLCNEIL